VPPSVFDGIPRFLECTYLAVRLATATELEFVQEPTVVYYEETPGSQSKSLAYVVGQEPALRRILELELPPDVRRVFSLRVHAARWQAAVALVRAGELRAALSWCLRALSGPGSWRFLARSAGRLVRPRLAR
jgi:hypothetical protein